MPDILRVFLDSNILFSVTHKPNHGFLRFWTTPEIVVMTSLYAARETRRNCKNQSQSQRLETLLEQTVIVSAASHNARPPDIDLPAKDVPILAATIDASADLLITGDKDHFSLWMNRPLKTRHGSLIIMRPRHFLDWLGHEF
jgi:predicted nucleic acid-binding protein